MRVCKGSCQGHLPSQTGNIHHAAECRHGPAPWIKPVMNLIGASKKHTVLVLCHPSRSPAIHCPAKQVREYLAEVGAQEKAADGVLHALAHLHQVLQDALGWSLLRPDVAGAHCTQQVPVMHRPGVKFCLRQGLPNRRQMPDASSVSKEPTSTAEACRNAEQVACRSRTG